MILLDTPCFQWKVSFSLSHRYYVILLRALQAMNLPVYPCDGVFMQRWVQHWSRLWADSTNLNQVTKRSRSSHSSPGPGLLEQILNQTYPDLNKGKSGF